MSTVAKHAILATCIVTLAAAGCTRNHPRPLALQTGQLDSGGGATSSSGANIAPEDICGEGRAADVRTVYFDYDSYALRPDALTTLKGNATIFSQDAQRNTVQIEGHCDERGTQEYNMALGERRALAVRDYLINLGVPARNLLTVSYGEERPAVIGSNEAAWSKNRRAEFSQGRAQ